MSTDQPNNVQNLIKQYFDQIYQLERRLERCANLDRYEEIAKASARLRQELRRVQGEPLPADKLSPADHVNLKNNLQILVNEYGSSNVQDALAVLLDLESDEEFLDNLENRSMSSWTDEELQRYAILTGQAEPSPAFDQMAECTCDTGHCDYCGHQEQEQ